MTLLLPAILVGYLIGSVPFGLIFSRLAGYGDIRRIGSGNIGATNVLRTGSKGLAAATLAADVLKGTVATVLGPLVALKLAPDAASDGVAVHQIAVAAYLAGAAAFFGHVFPVWLKFKGGKGVATYIGVLVGIAWPAAVVFCGAWLAVATATRYSSLSALVASFVAPFAAIFADTTMAGAVAAIMSVVLIFKHHANIHRLLRGEEPRIGAQS